MNYIDIDSVDISKIVLKEMNIGTENKNVLYIVPFYTFPDGKERRLFIKTAFLQINETYGENGPSKQFGKSIPNATIKGLMICIENHNMTSFLNHYDSIVDNFVKENAIEIKSAQKDIYPLVKYDKNAKIKPIKFKFAKNINIINYNISKKYAENEQLSANEINVEKMNAIIPQNQNVFKTKYFKKSTPSSVSLAQNLSEDSSEGIKNNDKPKHKNNDVKKEGRFIISPFTTINKQTGPSYTTIQTFNAEIKYKGAFIKSVLDKNEVVIEKKNVMVINL
jgi:hypothetical protein